MLPVIYSVKRRRLVDVMILFGISLLLISCVTAVLLPSFRVNRIIYFDIFRISMLMFSYFLFLAICFKRGRAGILLNKHDGLLFAFYLTLVLSVLWSVDVANTVKLSYHLFYYILFYLCFVIIMRERELLLHSLKYYFLLTPFVYLAGCLVIYFHYGTLRPSFYLQTEPGYFMVGSFSNKVAAATEIGIPFLYAYIISENKKIKALAVLSVFCSVSILLLSLSRGALLTTVLMTFMFFSFLVFIKGWRGVKGVGALIAAIVIMVIAMSYFPMFGEEVGFFEERIAKLEHIEDERRYELYKDGVDMIRERVFLGWGFGTHSTVMANKYNNYILLGGYGVGVASHNFIITIWSGAGIFSLLVFTYMIIYNLRKLYRIISSRVTQIDRDSLFAIAVYTVFAGTLLHGLVRPLLTNINFFFILAIISVFVGMTKVSSTPTDLKSMAK